MTLRAPVALACLLLGVRGAAAEEPPDPAVASARGVVEAHAKGDAETVRAAAVAKTPDPWLVADALLALALGGPEDGRERALSAARAFAAAAAERPTAPGLPALVERWAAPSPEERARDGRLRAARARQRDASARKARPEVVDAARSVATDLEAGGSVVAWAVRVDEHHALVALGRRREAEAAARQAGRIAETIGWASAAAGARNTAGGIAFALGDAARARDDVRAAIEIFERAGDAAGVRSALRNLAFLSLKSGQPREALALADRLHDDAEAAGDLRIAASASSVAGTAHRLLGEDDASDREHERAIEEYRRSGDPAGVLRVLVNWGAELTDTDRLSEAIVVHERALEALEDRPGDGARVPIHNNLSRLHHKLGNHEQALDHARRAVAAVASANEPGHAERAHVTLMIALGELGRHEECLAGLRVWREQSLEGGRKLDAADALANCAMELDCLGRLDEALDTAAAALAEFEALEDRWRRASTLTLLGQLRAKAGDVPGALEALDVSTAAHVALGDRTANRAVAHRARARVLVDAGRPREALADVRAALTMLRSVVRGLADEDALGAREDARQVADVGVRAALALADSDPALRELATAAAFEFAEAGRAGILAEGLANASALLAAALPPELLEEEAASRRAVEDARRAALGASGSEDARTATAAAKALDEAWRRRDDVAARVARTARRTAAFLAPPAPDLASAQAALAPDEALVAYHLTPFDAGAVVLRRGEARVVGLGPTRALSEAADAWLRLASAAGADDVAAASRLHALLVKPLETAIGDARRLVVVPDGILSFVPLEALATTSDGKRTRLVERYETSYAPSATVFLALRSEATARGDRVLAVGDPAPPAAGTALRALPASADEARDVASLVPEDRRLVLLGADASAERVLEALRRTDVRWRVVHFACHGVVDPQRRRGAGLVLAGGEVLGVDRLARLRVAADLSVLSACDSAKGAFARGEGVVGWSRALFLAGVPRVVTSSWVVSDRATRPFMRRFYEAHLRDGMPAAKALAEAKRAALREGGEAAHPAHWAAFTLWGLPD